MIKAAKHPQEAERIQALLKHDLLGDLASNEFDHIVRIAAYVCQTPMAVMTLLDGEKQWFKSKVGITAESTDQDISFCSHAILQNELFEVKNSLHDDRFKDNPLVTGDPCIQFYAGSPIIDPESKLPLGTLCVLDQKTHALTSDQKQILNDLSQQISQIIELKSLNKSLRLQHEKLNFQSTAIFNMHEGIAIQDRAGQIIDFNPAALKILSLSENQILGKTSMDKDWKAIKSDGVDFPGEEHPAMVALKTGQNVKDKIMGIRSGVDRLRWISINASPLYLDGLEKPSHAVTTFSDVTELKKTQESLIESAKLSSLGEMAAGVAHEINNPLGILFVMLENTKQIYLKKNLKDESVIAKLNENADRMQKTLDRISKIIKSLLKISRSTDKVSLSLVDFNEVCDDTINVCSEKLKKLNIDLRVDVETPFHLYADSVQLSQVLLNLINNSMDAIVNLDEKWIEIKALKHNSKIIISVIDSGSGIQSDLSNKIFMPFFTTKEVGQGTGLGLSISKKIIESLNGKMYLDSSKAHTTFILEFPDVALNEKIAG